MQLDAARGFAPWSITQWGLQPIHSQATGVGAQGCFNPASIHTGAGGWEIA